MRTQRDIQRDTATNKLREFISKLVNDFPELHPIDIPMILSSTLNYEIGSINKFYNIIGKDEGE